jgi:signal transduction histidine kinase
MRPLDKLPTIRAKLGSTIVVAVALTLAFVFLLLGYALRDTSRDSDRLELLSVARRAADGTLQQPPAGVSVITVTPDGRVVTGSPPAPLPPVTDGLVHVGVRGGLQYAVVPVVVDGGLDHLVYAVRSAPGTGLLDRVGATFEFLFRFWWQFLLAGAIAAAIALVLARWLARGMTQPLRDMAQAARRMETGDYAQRVHTTSRDEVGQLATAFNRMGAELESLERLRRELVANVSHELKTPISALRAHLENLLDGVEEPDRETLQVMLTQSERLSRLVDQLLDLSRLESGELPLRREGVPLRRLVAEVLSEVEVVRSGREVRVEDRVPDDIPPVFADRERLHQVLFNLLDNAVRLTPPGGEVVVSAHRVDGRCEVSVADTGPGIPAEHLPRLFERFYRVDTARARDDGGTGIGLAIARSVVEAHGGRIRAESEVGKGSVFTFDLRVAPAAGTETRRAS